MMPSVFYRVHDDSSATHFDGDGFFAGDDQTMLRMFPRNRWEAEKLFNALSGHLDWSNKTASPFISVYADFDTAVNSANARQNQGKRGVFIACIEFRKRSGTWSRPVREVADELGLWIEPPAWKNSEHEYIIFNRIPGEAVVDIITVS